MGVDIPFSAMFRQPLVLRAPTPLEGHNIMYDRFAPMLFSLASFCTPQTAKERCRVCPSRRRPIPQRERQGITDTREKVGWRSQGTRKTSELSPDLLVAQGSKTHLHEHVPRMFEL